MYAGESPRLVYQRMKNHDQYLESGNTTSPLVIYAITECNDNRKNRWRIETLSRIEGGNMRIITWIEPEPEEQEPQIVVVGEDNCEEQGGGIPMHRDELSTTAETTHRTTTETTHRTTTNPKDTRQSPKKKLRTTQ